MDAEQRFHARFFGSLRGTLDCLSWRRICCLRNTGLDAKSPQLLVTTGSCGLTLSLEAVQGQSVTSIARSADIHAETKSSLPVIGTVGDTAREVIRRIGVGARLHVWRDCLECRREAQSEAAHLRRLAQQLGDAPCVGIRSSRPGTPTIEHHIVVR